MTAFRNDREALAAKVSALETKLEQETEALAAAESAALEARALRARIAELERSVDATRERASGAHSSFVRAVLRWMRGFFTWEGAARPSLSRVLVVGFGMLIFTLFIAGQILKARNGARRAEWGRLLSEGAQEQAEIRRRCVTPPSEGDRLFWAARFNRGNGRSAIADGECCTVEARIEPEADADPARIIPREVVVRCQDEILYEWASSTGGTTGRAPEGEVWEQPMPGGGFAYWMYFRQPDSDEPWTRPAVWIETSDGTLRAERRQEPRFSAYLGVAAASSTRHGQPLRAETARRAAPIALPTYDSFQLAVTTLPNDPTIASADGGDFRLSSSTACQLRIRPPRHREGMWPDNNCTVAVRCEDAMLYDSSSTGDLCHADEEGRPRWVRPARSRPVHISADLLDGPVVVRREQGEFVLHPIWD